MLQRFHILITFLKASLKYLGKVRGIVVVIKRACFWMRSSYLYHCVNSRLSKQLLSSEEALILCMCFGSRRAGRANGLVV